MGVLRKRKQERGLRALASGSLAFARAHAVLDKTEKELEQEITRENRKPPESVIGKTRFKGQKLLHSKHVLMCIVLLNILDCILVLGELILDIYYLKGVLDSEHASTYQFVTDMRTYYPTELGYLAKDDIELLRFKLLRAKIDFSEHHSDEVLHLTTLSSTPGRHTEVTMTTEGILQKEASLTTSDSIVRTTLSRNETNPASLGHSRAKRDVKGHTQNLDVHLLFKRAAGVESNVSPSESSIGTEEGHGGHHDDHSIEEKVAHIFHYCSVTILGILVVETILKLFCNRREFFEKKLEVFDGFIVMVSFIVDLVFIKGLSSYEIQQFVVILAFLVPWRVIRVVNSLVVAVIDHEHFRMKLLYKQKKEVSNGLKNVKNENISLKNTLERVKNMAIKGGVSEKAINGLIALHTQAHSSKKSKTMVNGFTSSLIGKTSSGLSLTNKTSARASVDSARASNLESVSETHSNNESHNEDRSVFVNIGDEKTKD